MVIYIYTDNSSSQHFRAFAVGLLRSFLAKTGNVLRLHVPVHNVAVVEVRKRLAEAALNWDAVDAG